MIAVTYAGIEGIAVVKAHGALDNYSLADARPQLQLNPEQASYKVAVEKLGVDFHRFVECDLVNGKMRIGKITEIHEDGFTLENGMFLTKFIPYTDLRSSPRPVAAVGTRISQGFMWTGLVLIAIPLLPFAYFTWWDGC